MKSVYEEVGRDRLLKLAHHLNRGKLGHEVFNFSTYNSKPNECGTAGCAIGECPIVWPRDWRFNDSALPGLRNGSREVSADGQAWFGLNWQEYINLFVPTSGDRRGEWNIYELTHSATKEEVAVSIERFVVWKDKQIAAVA